MKIRILLLFVFTVVFLCPFPVTGGRVVYFNPDSALDQLRKQGFFKKENKAFNRKVGVVNKRLKNMQKELSDIKQELIKLKKMDQQEDLEKLTKKYKKKLKKFRKYLKESNEKISEKRREVKGAVEESLLTIVNEYAARKNYNVVLEENSGSIVFVHPKWNITDKVVDIYIQRFNSLKEATEGSEFKPDENKLTKSKDRLYHLGMKYFKEQSYDQASMVWERMLEQSESTIYTVILQTSCQEKEIKKIFEELESSDTVFLLTVPMSSRSCYRICHGLFENKAQAQKNLDSLRLNGKISFPNAYIFNLQE